MDSTLIIYYIETNLICFLFVAFVLYSYARESRGLTESKWFVLSLVTVQVYCIADIIAALFKNRVFFGARALLLASNTIYIAIPIILVLFWNRYISEHTRAYYRPARIFRFLDRFFPIAAYIICAIALSAPITRSTFYLDELNTYHRTLGAYLVPVFAYMFMVYETVKLQIIRKNSESLPIKRDANILSLFAVPCIFFSLVQVILYGTTVSQVGFTMALMIVFMGRTQNKVSRDELTGLNNRREYEYAIDRISKNSENAMIVMVDVDDFKSINDNYGHLEGDNALKAVSMILKKACSDKKGVALYRYGGDEFIMLSTEPNYEVPKEMLVSAITDETAKYNDNYKKPYRINLSIGAACGSCSGSGIYKLIETADKEMYKIKTGKKHRT